MKEPALTGGDLAAGQTAEGWMTFQLPIELTSITVTYSDGIFGDEHEWVVGATTPPRVQSFAATPMPAPTAGPTSTPEPTTKPSPRRGLGYTYADPNIRVTLERVEWNTGDTFFKPDEGKQWVSVLVRYVARQPADFDLGQDWAVVDNDGFDGEQQFFTPKDVCHHLQVTRRGSRPAMCHHLRVGCSRGSGRYAWTASSGWSVGSRRLRPVRLRVPAPRSRSPRTSACGRSVPTSQ